MSHKLLIFSESHGQTRPFFIYNFFGVDSFIEGFLIRPSLKGGLCMSAGQKNRDVVVVVVVAKFEIREVWLIQPCSRDGQSIK